MVKYQNGFLEVELSARSLGWENNVSDPNNSLFVRLAYMLFKIYT